MLIVISIRRKASLKNIIITTSLHHHWRKSEGSKSTEELGSKGSRNSSLVVKGRDVGSSISIPAGHKTARPFVVEKEKKK